MAKYLNREDLLQRIDEGMKDLQERINEAPKNHPLCKMYQYSLKVLSEMRDEVISAPPSEEPETVRCMNCHKYRQAYDGKKHCHSLIVYRRGNSFYCAGCKDKKSHTFCKWYSNGYEKCENIHCPYFGDLCPVAQHQDICRFAEVKSDG